ncbi:hypothetical protein N7508_002610 [Penicillium antarcticum]|uniref:uncharacterized protein n=1 Tax=Penicillium antarcticum TaxID=416450 RepID=UPI00239C2583|nr:uncharacterized protein N7508_002610 [Penicillium antarcticum]KAJ5318102.1 hypothetical protein N7508_002610 [Penicillium antarcticum]
MAPNPRVSVIQWQIKPLDPEYNHAKACEYIRQAANQKAELVVLPEYHLSGWVPNEPLWSTQADSSPEYLLKYRALANELGISLVPGTIIEKYASENNTTLFYNTAYFISKDGSILSSYRKKNIWHPERPHLTSSAHERHVAFDTPVGRVGMLICWDLAFPEAFRELIADGAKIVIIPTFWTPHDASPEARKSNPDCEALFLETTITARCFENTCAVIFANAAGAEKDFLGLSQITLPITGPVGKMGAEEGILVRELDVGVVDAAEANYKVRKDLKREDWYYSYRHSVKE